MKHHELRAGCAAADITPATGIHMGGYWGRRSGAVDVHDALRAKVLVFEQGGRKAGLSSLDLIGLDAGTVQRIRERIQEEVGISGEAFMVCCSHTHSGPLTLGFRGMGEMDPEYLERVEDEIVRLAGQAVASIQEARLAYRRVPVQTGLNRRRSCHVDAVSGQSSAGPVAPWAHVVRVDAPREQLATLFSHACHPVVLGKSNHSISGDFAGAASRFVEARTQKPALFVNGACGDINPRIINGRFADVEDLGAELGRAVVEGLATAQALEGTDLHYCVEKLQLPLLDPPSQARMQIEELTLRLKAKIVKIARQGGDVWEQMVPQARLAWARDMLELARAGARGRRQVFEIQGLRLGALRLLGMEGEIFVRYQLDLEAKTPLQPTMLCGFANGCIGYVPTADEYERGGYEIEEAYKAYPSVQMIAPESEGLVRASAEAVLRELSAL